MQFYSQSVWCLEQLILYCMTWSSQQDIKIRWVFHRFGKGISSTTAGSDDGNGCSCQRRDRGKNFTMSKLFSFRKNRAIFGSWNQWRNRSPKGQLRFQKLRKKRHLGKRNQTQRQELALQQRTVGGCGCQT